MDLLHRVRVNLYRHRMVERGRKVMVAVSGGPDSVALLHILYLLKEELEISLHVAHLNHMFRGAESEADALFVADMAERYGLPATVESLDVPAYRDQNRLSGQVAAREVRYRFFYETANRVGAYKVALAHQADDQAETILINFLRGTGITGLKGISPVREGIYIRPLLTVRRSEIERYCDEMSLSFRQDSSNIKPVYTRNRVRMNLMPLLEREYNPGLVPALLRLGEICREEDSYLEEQAEKAYQDALQAAAAGRVVLRLDSLRGTPVAIRRRVLRRAWQFLTGELKNLAFQHAEAALDLLYGGATGSRAVLPGNVVAVRSYNTLELIKEQGKLGVSYYIHPVKVPGATYIPELDRTVYAALAPRSPAHDPKSLPPEEALLDYEKLPPQIFVRRRLEGDVFYPFGQVSELKLKDFFIKQKVPREERDRIPLVSTPEEIVWVGGMRTGERWKVDEKTARVLHLKLTRGLPGPGTACD